MSWTREKTQLISHIATKIIVTRLEVTSSAYLRCREIARSLSTAMAVTFRNDAKATQTDTKREILKISGHSTLRFKVADITKTAATVVWANNPTARSQKARLSNNFLKLGGNDEAFHSARIAREFPSVATGQKTKCSTLNDNSAVFWDSKSRRRTTCQCLQYWSVMTTPLFKEFCSDQTKDHLFDTFLCNLVSTWASFSGLITWPCN